MKSKLLTLVEANDGTITVAAQADAKASDILTSAISTDKVLTGTYGLVQRLAIFEAGNITGGMLAGRGFVSAATFGQAGN